MSDERFSDFDESDPKDSNLPHELGQGATETIDLASLFITDVTETGSFDISGNIWATTFGKLLQALPIPAFLIDSGHTVLHVNEACAKISPEYKTTVGGPFCGFFRSTRSYEKVRSLLEEIFATRKAAVVQAVLSIGERKIYGRITFRSLRIMKDRFALALIEDLTNEKIQLQINERLKQELERRVEERTVMLSNLNKSLKQAEQRYRRLFEDAPLMYVITRNEGGVPYITECNQFFLRAVGYSREEVVGQPLEKFYSGESVAQLLEGGGYERALTGEFVVGERQLLTRNGSPIPALLYNIPEEDPSGQIIGTRAMFADITDRKKAEDALQDSEERLRAVVYGCPIPQFVIDRDRRVIFWNKALEEISGIRAEEVVGTKHHWKAFYTKERPCLADLLVDGDLKGIADWYGGKCHRSELLLDAYGVTDFIQQLGRDGKWLYFTAAVIRDSKGNVVGAVETLEDITDRKKAEDALRDSEERYRISFENVKDVIYSLNSRLEIIDITPSVEKALGYSPSELLGKKVMDLNLMCPSSLMAALQDARRALCGETLENRIYEFIHKNGTIKYGELTGTPLVRDGRIVGAVAVGRDITDRKKAEEALTESEQKYRALFEESVDGVYSVLRDGEITDANPSFLEMLCYTREEMIGMDISELYVDPSDRLTCQQELEKKGFVKDYEVNWRKSNGTEIDVALTLSVYFGKDGSIAGYRGISRDVTERKGLERQLLQAQKMEAMGTLAGGVAHEINNLLQIVLGRADMLLRRGGLDETCGRSLEAIRRAARDGSDLVNRILTFSRKAEPKMRPLNLNDEVRRIEEMLRRTIPRMISIEMSLQDDLQLISADPSQIEQVVLNLAINARDAMPDGGRLVLETKNVPIRQEYCRIHPEVKPGKYVLLAVSDTGLGIDEKVSDRIFEPFFTTKQPGQGSGLGLSIVFGVVKSHGAHITCYSEAGVGSTFKIFFPVSTDVVIPGVATTIEMPAGGTETLLLVDDEDDVRTLGAEMLEMAGYTVLTAANGREALEVYRRNNKLISLMILDLIMPEISGRQCLEQLLKINPKAKVLIASGYSAEGPAKEARESGATGFVNKPFDLKQILLAIRKCLDSG